MMWKSKWSRFTECACRKSGLVLVILPCLLLLTLYFATEDDLEYQNFQYPSYKAYNSTADGAMDGYLVWNTKCRMLSIDPMDPSIRRFVRKEKFEACSKTTPLARILPPNNGTNGSVLELDDRANKKNLSCCWSAIFRPEPQKPPKDKFDSTITIKKCEELQNRTFVPREVEVLLITCKEKTAGSKNKRKGKSGGAKTIYENIHAILNVEKVRDRLNETNYANSNGTRKLSILFIGIDSVSRLNFQRAMPKTEKHLRETGWISMKGYNKMGENTFPNLMAILTGQNQQQAYGRCKPTVPYRLDTCPFIWHDYRNAGYITAYGEDETVLNTFNYLKVGFVEPPTDYYLRPYILASEKLLKIKKRFSGKYCTGPELSFERIVDYGMNFAQTFIGYPYFGFFWTNTVSHDNMNGPSSVDDRVLSRLKRLNESGVLRDAMVIFLSDHGMRYGDIRNTFVGWYEERLPFLYISLPEWFKTNNPRALDSLRANENRLTSPYDLYETLRHVVGMAGGEANSSAGCNTCQSLLEPVPRERGCKDAGIAPHWCTCVAFQPTPIDDEIVRGAVRGFLDHVEKIVVNFKDKKNNRLCAKLRLKKIHRVSRVYELPDDESRVDETDKRYFFMIQVSPGDGKFEATVRYHGPNNYTITDDQVSRINSYASSAKCLDHGPKHYCHCVK